MGVSLDQFGEFEPLYIRALKARCLKALDVLKVLAATESGADSTVLLQLYRALVRSKLDCGQFPPSFIHQVIIITGLNKLQLYVLALKMALDADRA